MKLDCIGRKLKVGDYVSFYIEWPQQKMVVAKITKLCNTNISVYIESVNYWTGKSEGMKNYYVDPSLATKIEDGPELTKYLLMKD